MTPTLIGIVDPNPCTLTASVSTGVTECDVTLGPGSNTKEGDTLAVDATYSPSDTNFRPSTTGFSAKYTPTLDPTNKVTAARAEAHLIAWSVRPERCRSWPPRQPSSPHRQQRPPDCSPCRFTTSSFPTSRLIQPTRRSSILASPAWVARASSKALSAALTALNRNNAAIEGWAGAEWNALNRSVIARQANDRAAFVTQLLAESRNEKMLAELVAKLPAEMKAIARNSPARYRKASVGVSTRRLATLVKRARKNAAAQRRLFHTVGIPAAVVAGMITGSHPAVTRKSVGRTHRSRSGSRGLLGRRSHGWRST